MLPHHGKDLFVRFHDPFPLEIPVFVHDISVIVVFLFKKGSYHREGKRLPEPSRTGKKRHLSAFLHNIPDEQRLIYIIYILVDKFLIILISDPDFFHENHLLYRNI